MADLCSKRPCDETQSGCITLSFKHHISMVIAKPTLKMFVNVFRSSSVLISECRESSWLPGCKYIVKHREEKSVLLKEKTDRGI